MKSAIAQEALDRAENGQSLTNYPSIFAGFLAMGIPESEIIPRETVLTYHAWIAKGRQVIKGQHGVKVVTWIPVTKTERSEDGTENVRSFRRPKTAVVFHVSQTKAV